MHEYGPADASASDIPGAHDGRGPAVGPGPEGGRAVLLIHPMLSSAEGMKGFLADRMAAAPGCGDLAFLVPDLSAHGEAAGEEYASAASEAEQIHAWLAEHGRTSLALGYGASLGGVVLFELLRYPDISFERLFFEGTSFFTGAPVTEALIRSVFLKKRRKAAADPERAARKMAGRFGGEAARPLAEHFAAMSEASVRNVVHDCADVRLPVLSLKQQAGCTFAYGKKDPDLGRARKTIPGFYPKAELRVWPGFGHCGRLSRDSDAYAAMLAGLLAR